MESSLKDRIEIISVYLKSKKNSYHLKADEIKDIAENLEKVLNFRNTESSTFQSLQKDFFSNLYKNHNPPVEENFPYKVEENLFFYFGIHFRDCGGADNFRFSHQCFSQCLNEDETNPIFWNERGHTSYLQVNFSGGFQDFTKAISLDTKNQMWPSYYGRGIIAYRMSKWSVSEKDFKKALELNPNLEDAKNYLKLVEKGKNDHPEYDDYQLYYIQKSLKFHLYY